MPPAAVIIGLGAVSAVGQLQQGQEAKQSADAQAAEFQQQAFYAREKAATEIGSNDYEASSVLARARATAGAMGVAESGSPQMVNDASATRARLRDAYIRYGGEAEASEDLYKAALSKWQGSNEQTSSSIGAGTSMLTSIFKGNMAPGGNFLPQFGSNP